MKDKQIDLLKKDQEIADLRQKLTNVQREQIEKQRQIAKEKEKKEIDP